MSCRRNATGASRPVRGPRALFSSWSSLLDPGADCGAPTAAATGGDVWLLHASNASRCRQML